MEIGKIKKLNSNSEAQNLAKSLGGYVQKDEEADDEEYWIANDDLADAGIEVKYNKTKGLYDVSIGSHTMYSGPDVNKAKNTIIKSLK